MNRNSLKHCTLGSVFIGFLVVLTFGCSVDRPVQGSPSSPLVIAHRGASGQRPEHTLAAYELALVQGADFIELDLVATSDSKLIARHENVLAMVVLDEDGGIVRESDGAPRIREATTDVATRGEFADRLTVKTVDGRSIGGWFSEDFTLREVRSLKARERLPRLRQNNRLHDDRYGVPTLADVIELVREFERRTSRQAGLYIEIKHPTYFLHEGQRVDGSAIGVDLGALLLEHLSAAAFTAPERVFVQSFEIAPLIIMKDRMTALGLDIPLIQLFGDVFNLRFRSSPRDIVYHVEQGSTIVYGELEGLVPGGLGAKISYAELVSPAVLAFMARRYATGIGPVKHNILLTRVSSDAAERGAAAQPRLSTRELTGEIGSLLPSALDAGLVVHPYTLRAETPFLVRYHNRPLTVVEEAGLLLESGVQGFFIDQPAEGRLAVYRYLAGKRAIE